MSTNNKSKAPFISPREISRRAERQVHDDEAGFLWQHQKDTKSVKKEREKELREGKKE